jgi:low affinity Fe/Cu permease
MPLIVRSIGTAVEVFVVIFFGQGVDIAATFMKLDDDIVRGLVRSCAYLMKLTVGEEIVKKSLCRHAHTAQCQ